MADETRNRYGLTEAQIGKNATDEKAAQYPTLDVRGRKYLRGEISVYPLTSTTFVVVPAGYPWTKEAAAEAFKEQWEKQQAVSISEPALTEEPKAKK